MNLLSFLTVLLSGAAPVLAEPLVCTLCKSTLNSLSALVRSPMVIAAETKLAYLVCRLVGQSENFCDLQLGALIPIIGAEVLPERMLNTTYMCNFFSLCESHSIQRSTFRDFQRRVLIDVPPLRPPRTHRSGKSIKLVQIADVHLDPFYTQNASKSCGEVMCCRANSGPATNSSDAAGYWATLGRCDVPLHTVEQIISYIKREIAPDIVLWLGDTVYASPYNVSKESERAVLSTVTRLIKSAFPSSVFPILGNHEGSPSDMFDFHHVDREQWLLDLTGGLWSDWLHPAALKQFMQTGYYTQLVPGHPRLRVVALNLFLYSDNNMYTNYNSTDPLAQIRWLSETLAKAEQAGERVLVITHVPTCADRGTEEGTGRMMTLFERYANIIVGVFAGHYHRDFVRVLRSFRDGSPFGLEFVSPSVTAFNGVNPAFTVLELDAEDFSILEMRKYLFDVEASNRVMSPVFRQSYNLTEHFGLAALTPAEMSRFASKVGNDPATYSLFARTYVSETFRAQEMVDLGRDGMRFYYCLLTARLHSEFAECTNYNFVGDWEERLYWLLQYLQTSWEYLVPRGEGS